jgi:predicted dienelactone hydrolase
VTAYDPFARGPFPVGVRTVDERRGPRALPIEVWYPATDDHAGRDRAPETRDAYELLPGLPPAWQEAVRDATARLGRFPLVVFSHGYGGHRRQSTFLCTHLASHGYVVAAVEHTGNTIVEVAQAVMARHTGGAMPDPGAVIDEFVVARPADVSFAIDRVTGGAGGLESRVDPDRIGVAGHSFGGWTTLAVTARDRRVRAALPLAPAGGGSQLPVERMRDALDFAWGREVPTLFVVADRDTLLPLAGMHELFARTPAGKRMVVLRDADHMHFCDRAEEVHEMFRLMPQDPVFASIQAAIPPIAELCPGDHAALAIRGVGVAHMDAHLKGDEPAARFLAGDVRAALAARGVAVDVL